jgi:hypothetical protein
LTGQNQHQQVDHLFRYEDLSQVVQFFEQRLGTTIDLPWLNTSTSKELILSKGVEHRLRKKRAQDFELYDRASIGAS